jgi:hypothetical protein
MPSRYKKGITFSSTTSRQPLESSQPSNLWVLVDISLEVQRPGLKADHSSAFSAELKNAWSYPSTPSILLVGWFLIGHRDNFTFTSIFESG